MVTLILVVPLLIGLLVLAFVWWTRSRETGEVWEAFAQSQDLEYDDTGSGPATIRGTYASRPIRIHTGSGGESYRWTVFEAALPEAVPADLYVGYEDIISRLGKALGGQDLEVGRPEFDDAFIIRADDPEVVDSLFDRPRVAELLLDLKKSNHFFEIAGGALKLYLPGLATQSTALRENLDELVDHVRRLETAWAGEPARRVGDDDNGRPRPKGPYW